MRALVLAICFITALTAPASAQKGLASNAPPQLEATPQSIAAGGEFFQAIMFDAGLFESAFQPMIAQYIAAIQDAINIDRANQFTRCIYIDTARQRIHLPIEDTRLEINTTLLADLVSFIGRRDDFDYPQRRVGKGITPLSRISNDAPRAFPGRC